MSIDKTTAQALANYVGRLRPDWDYPGIYAAIGRAKDLGSAAAISAALCRIAEDLTIRTPAVLPEPGPHWGGTAVAGHKRNPNCPEHPGEPIGRCRPCAEQATAGPPPGWRDALPRAERRAPARTNPVDAARSTPEQHEAALARCQSEPDPQETP